MADTSGRRRRRWSVRWAVTAAVVVALLAVGGETYAGISAPGARYRTAVVTRGAVTASLDGTATLTPKSSASVTFPVAGTVKTVAVTAGAQVQVGSVLARLDTTSLEATVRGAEASLANARLALSRDESGESSGTGGGGATSTGAVPSGVAAGTGTAVTAAYRTGSDFSTEPSVIAVDASSPAGGVAGLAPLQQAVLAAQRQVDADLQTATADLAAARSTCRIPSLTPSSSAAGGTAAAGKLLRAACLRAQQRVLRDETTLTDQQQTLLAAESALDAALAKLAAAAGRTPPPAPSAPPSARPPGPTSGRSGSHTSTTNPGSSGRVGGSGATSSGNTQHGTSSGAASSGGGGTAVTAEQLASDQAAIDAAQANVRVADQNLAQATIVSPLTGTVASVGVGAGSSVTAGSASSAIVVVGPGSYQATMTVTASQVPVVKIGQSAVVRPDGSTRQLAGTVTSVGILPVSSGSSTAYSVIVGLGTSSGLRNGAAGAVSLVLARTNGLSVPTSAVHTIGPARIVDVLSGGKVTATRVTVATMGAATTSIRSGVTAGQRVVLADLSASVPSATTGAITRAGRAGFGGTGLTGGFGGTGR